MKPEDRKDDDEAIVVRNRIQAGYAETIEVSFANDRFVNDPLNPSEPIRISTDERDKEYFVYSAGMSIQLIRGIAGFLNYRTAQNLENLSLTDITWGLRFETEW